MAKGGPSPLIPLLLVVALGLFLRSNSFALDLNLLPLVSEAEQAIFMCIVFVPFLVLLAIYSTRHTIVLPLAIVLGMYMVSTMLLGPLMLILIVYVASVYLPVFKCNGEELGWAFLIVVVFVLLQWVLSDESGRSWLLLLAVVILLYYHFRS